MQQGRSITVKLRVKIGREVVLLRKSNCMHEICMTTHTSHDYIVFGHHYIFSIAQLNNSYRNSVHLVEGD